MVALLISKYILSLPRFIFWVRWQWCDAFYWVIGKIRTKVASGCEYDTPQSRHQEAGSNMFRKHAARFPVSRMEDCGFLSVWVLDLEKRENINVLGLNLSLKPIVEIRMHAGFTCPTPLGVNQANRAHFHCPESGNLQASLRVPATSGLSAMWPVRSCAWTIWGRTGMKKSWSLFLRVTERNTISWLGLRVLHPLGPSTVRRCPSVWKHLRHT